MTVSSRGRHTPGAACRASANASASIRSRVHSDSVVTVALRAGVVEHSALAEWRAGTEVHDRHAMAMHDH